LRKTVSLGAQAARLSLSGGSFGAKPSFFFFSFPPNAGSLVELPVPGIFLFPSFFPGAGVPCNRRDLAERPMGISVLFFFFFSPPPLTGAQL